VLYLILYVTDDIFRLHSVENWCSQLQQISAIPSHYPQCHRTLPASKCHHASSSDIIVFEGHKCRTELLKNVAMVSPTFKMNQVTYEGSSCQFQYLPMLHFVAKIENHQIALRHFRFQEFFKKNLGREKQGSPVLTTGSQKMGRNTKEGNSDRLSPRCWGYSTPMNFFGRPSTHTSQKSPKGCSLVQSAILSFNNFHPMELSLHPSALNC